MWGVYALVLAACIIFLSFLVRLAISSTRAECMPTSHGLHIVFNREHPLLKSFCFTEQALRVGRREYPIQEILSLRFCSHAEKGRYGVVEVRFTDSKKIRLYFMEKDGYSLKQVINQINISASQQQDYR